MLVQKKINVRIMAKFKSLTDGNEFECIDIKTHDIVNGRKNSLPEPLFHFRYTNIPGGFISRMQDVRRALIFNQWEEVKV